MKRIVLKGFLISAFLMTGCTGTRPSSVGLSGGLLSVCPSSPNCVVSMHGEEKHFIEPFVFSAGKEEAARALKKVLAAQERVTIVEETGNYICAEFKTKLMGFVDDVEFYFPEDADVIHIRSASRIGYSDMGLNRKRMESLRTLFMAALENKTLQEKE